MVLTRTIILSGLNVTPMKSLTTALLVALGLLAVSEHAALLLYGVAWPLRHLAQYPGDGGVNLFMIEASLLFLAFSLGAALDVRHSIPRLATLAAMTLALPCGLSVTLALMRVLFLDPVVEYLILLPGILAVLCPYGLAALLARRHRGPTPPPATAA